MRFRLVETLLVEIYPNKGESKKDFIARFMSATKDEYPDTKQRYAVALSYWDRRDKKKNESVEDNKKDIADIENYLKGLSVEDLLTRCVDYDEKDFGKYTVWVWSDELHFGSAWTPKPVIHIQIDSEDKPNGYLGWGDIETIDEYDRAVERLIKKMRAKDESLDGDKQIEGAVKLKTLKKGDYFTRKPIAEPKESQVFIKDDYDRETKKFLAIKFSDAGGAGIQLSGDTIVYTDFTF